MSSSSSSVGDFESNTKVTLLEEGWDIIQRCGIQRLHTIVAGGCKESLSNADFIPLYGIVYKMCTQKSIHCYTAQLYVRYQQSLTQYLTSTSLPAIAQQRGDAEQLLRETVKQYNDHTLISDWMCRFFRYLNQYYVPRHNKKCLEDVAVEQFRVCVFEKEKQRLTAALLELIAADRDDDGIVVDRDLLRQSILIYASMRHRSYYDDFETPFLKATHAYYKRRTTAWVTADSCPEYLRKAERCIYQERRRVTDYLLVQSTERLMTTLFNVLLLDNQTEIIGKENTGCLALLQQHAVDDLGRMYHLYSRAPDALAPIARLVHQHITTIGTEIIAEVNASKSTTTFVQQLMAHHDRYYDMVRTVFGDGATFHRALKDAFEQIVNERAVDGVTTAELLASYCDTIMRKDGAARTIADTVSDVLDGLVRLFSYLVDKDLFCEFYRTHLSKRLLLQRSASDDWERDMIGKLKLKCGAQFTSKLEGMMSDVSKANSHVDKFRDFLRDRSINIGVDFTVQTLTTGFWPTYKTDEVQHLPHAMKRCIDVFGRYYNEHTNNRCLRWVHNLGAVTLSAHFTKKTIDLMLSAVQATILMLFNTQDMISVAQVIEMTGIDADEVKRQLRPLVSQKEFKVLLKKPPTGYAPDHLLKVNMSYTNANRRVRVPATIGKTTKSERNASEAIVDEGRRFQIEANIVRVMKARQTCKHAELVAEVSKQLMSSFKPVPRVIKQRIEDLIQRDYLERVEGGMYKYLA